MLSNKRERTPPPIAARVASRGSAVFSVVGTDVTIKGDIIAKADLHVEGTVEGDVYCASLVQGQSSRIEGTIEAQSVRLAGHVKGRIKARELIILKSAHIEGDVHYEALTIEQGATVNGSFAPDAATPAGERAVTGDRVIAAERTAAEPHLSLAG